MTVVLTRRLPSEDSASAITATLALTAEERSRSRHHFTTADGRPIYLNLPRGTVLQQGDRLTDDAGESIVQIIAKPEPVMTVTASTPLALLRAAYHLGNRHVALEVTTSYLRLSPDPVLRDLATHLGLQIEDDILPFQPEPGAYGSVSSAPHSHHAHG